MRNDFMFWDSAPVELQCSDGGVQIDTEQGCSACGGDCPCPQACERREEARQYQAARAAT